MAEPLCMSVLAKIHEQIERTEHLIGLLPPENLDWGPSQLGFNCWPTAKLLGHLMECLAGFCAVLFAANPEQLPHFSRLRDMRVNHWCEASEARDRIALYRAHIDEGFGLLRDTDLTRCLPTVFVSAGEPVLTLLLGNFEHLVNHKHQLFTYLKLMGAGIATRDLYQFRNEL
jgi:hypothetical protein